MPKFKSVLFFLILYTLYSILYTSTAHASWTTDLTPPNTNINNVTGLNCTANNTSSSPPTMTCPNTTTAGVVSANISCTDQFPGNGCQSASYVIRPNNDLPIDFSSQTSIDLSSQTSIDLSSQTLNLLKIFGQKKVTETSRNLPNEKGIYHASGIIVDKNTNPNKVYVVDTGNNRVLGYNGVGFCSTSSQTCTVDNDCGSGATCNVDGSKNPDIVFGQDNFTDASCNRDNNKGFTKPPTSSTLCLTPYPVQSNIGEWWMRTNIDTDSEGNLYVIDEWNNRILKYNQPFSSDKTAGKGDNIADFVIGQKDMTTNGVNQGSNYKPFNSPTPISLWLNQDYNRDFVSSRGVSVDLQKNIWVADTFNGRVLRFPAGGTIANLVLGQTDFTSRNDHACSDNAPLNEMCTPTLAKVDPESGNLYVVDEYPPAFKARILLFQPPFTNGMPASKVIIPKDASWTGSPYVFSHATGLMINTFRQGEYAAGKFWIHDGGSRTLLLDNDGNVIKVIGAKDKNSATGDIAYVGCNSSIYDNFNLGWPGGSIGLDSSNNIYLADERSHRISRYSLPYQTRTVNGQVCLPIPNGGLFPGNEANVYSNEKLGGGVGVAVFQNQLIILDENRELKVWNDYLNKPIGSPPDYVISGTMPSRILFSQAIDDANRLWMFGGHSELKVYQLPFRSSNDQPLADFIRLYWSDDNSQINIPFVESGLTFDSKNKALYLADRLNHRVLRVKDYNNFSSGLHVDMVIGQPNKTSIKCNFNQDMPWLANGIPTANSLCNPLQVKFDRLGNLYVVESGYECHGNNRISVFMEDDLKNSTGLFPMISAKKIFNQPDLTIQAQFETCSYTAVDKPGTPISIAFNNANQMFIGNDGYYGDSSIRQLRQLWFYADPLNKQTPDGYINLPMGIPGEIAVDTNSNLIIQDHGWNRVLVINLSLDPIWLVSRSPSVVDITGSSETKYIHAKSIDKAGNVSDPKTQRVNFVPAPIPTVTVTPACITGPITGTNEVNISWTNNDLPVSQVDISTDNQFRPSSTIYQKQVSGSPNSPTSTTAPAGFAGLTVQPGTTYYVRLWNGSYSLNPASFNIPRCLSTACTGTTSGTSITWSATPPTTGGTSPYSYSWSSVDGLSGTGQTIGRTYTTAGTKNATITATDNSSPIQTATNTCSATVSCPAAVSCPSTCHTDTQYVSNGSCGQTTCLPNNTTNFPVQDPPICRTTGGSVLDGQCSTTLYSANCTTSCSNNACVPAAFTLNTTPTTSCQGASPTIPLSWGSSAEVQSYEVFRNTTSIGNTTQTTYNDNNLSNDTSYSYYVEAINGPNRTRSNTVTITSRECRPDLICQNAAASGTLLTGQNITLSATVKNQGASNAGASNTQFKIDSAEIGTAATSSLAPNETEPKSITWTATAGNHTLTINADSANTVAESDENNNSCSTSTSFTVCDGAVSCPGPTTCHTDTVTVADGINTDGTCKTKPCAPNQPALELCPNTCHSDTQFVYDGTSCNKTGVCSPNNPPAQTPPACRTTGGTVDDGQCSTNTYLANCTTSCSGSTCLPPTPVLDPPAPDPVCSATGTPEINVSWTVSSAQWVDHYLVYRQDGATVALPTGWCIATNCTYLDTTVSPLTFYQYQVIAYSTDNSVAPAASNWSSSVQALSCGPTPTPPPASTPGPTPIPTPTPPPASTPGPALIFPWIQTTGGDVHSNEKINTGP